MRTNERPIEIVENTWIPLRDGCRLAARMWIPADASTEPVPAVLEYLPYRKRDGTSLRDEITHPYFAAHGYACVRVDMRGNGDSDGLMHDEYTAQELADGVEVIQWLAAQAWCSGAVGMIGISWGGFNGLQIGALNPQPLRAIVTLCSTDDRYANDIHYMGGCLLNDNAMWSQQMLGYSSRPPDPALVGDSWRALWIARMENMPFLAGNWLRHPHRDAYWKHGSVCEDYAAIRAPVLAVGGWADAYAPSIPRLLAGLECPRKAIIGPWEHKYPNIAHIEPRIDILAETVRWWDEWLKDIDTGVTREPDLRAYLLDSAAPDPRWGRRPGRWVAEARWPSHGIHPRELFLGEGTLSTTADAPARAIEVSTPQHLGAACGAFCPGMRIDDELPPDQSVDDALAVCFDSAPLPDALEILGAPSLQVEFECDRPQALLAARLCDVRPDGSVARITWGPLNLTHHDSHESPAALQAGRRYRATLALKDIGYVVPPGHRLRLALSTTYWPMLWPSPEPATVTVHAQGTRLLIPARERDDEQPLELASLPPPALPPRVTLRAQSRRTITGELGADGFVASETEDDFGAVHHPGTGLTTGSQVRQNFRIHPHDPLSATAEGAWTHEMAREGWQVRSESRTCMISDREHFHVEAQLLAFEDGELVFDRTWKERIPRQLI